MHFSEGPGCITGLSISLNTNVSECMADDTYDPRRERGSRGVSQGHSNDLDLSWMNEAR